MTEISNIIFEKVGRQKRAILKKVPNLDPEDYVKFFYLGIGYHLGKERYFGLTFTLEDAAHKEELRNLSNGYFEFIDGTVRMGVNELEKLEKILKAHYIKPRSIHIL